MSDLPKGSEEAFDKMWLERYGQATGSISTERTQALKFIAYDFWVAALRWQNSPKNLTPQRPDPKESPWRD